MKVFIFMFVFISGALFPEYTDPAEDQKSFMVNKVNEIRQKGCYCGRRYMEPAPPIKWNSMLYNSAFTQAKDMKENNFFDHYSNDGLNIGQRLHKVGYDWMVAGENIGEGQESFEEVHQDWLKSYKHCIMVMDPRVEEMAIAKVDKYWVQHFGKKMPLKNK